MCINILFNSLSSLSPNLLPNPISILYIHAYMYTTSNNKYILTSVITWPSNYFFMFLIATTKATTTAVVVKEEAGGSTAHTRDNNETKNEENDLLIFEAHEDALNSFEYGGSMSRKMAFMDILPVLRTMLRSEAARKDTILEVKRSNRAGRFLHYLDSIGLHLDETTRMVLQRPFSIL